MTEPFHFFFARCRHVMEGEVCRDITLGRNIVDSLAANLDLGTLPCPAWIDGTQEELTEYLLLDDDELTPEICFNACVSVLLLLLAIDKLDDVHQHAGILVYFDRAPDDPLDGKVLLRVQGYDQAAAAEIITAMKTLGAAHRDLRAEVHTATAAERKGATIH